MAEGVQTPDGKPLDIETAKAKAEAERAFAAAMAAPVGDEKAPPKRDDRADRKTPDEDRERPRVDKRPRGRPRKDIAKSGDAGLSRDERVAGVKGLVQLGAGVCLLAERATGQKAFRADAITLASSADELATAVADTASADEKLARVVDKVCSAGPYAALITVVVGVGSQIARNHGAAVPGTRDPADLLKAAEKQEQDVAPAAA